MAHRRLAEGPLGLAIEVRGVVAAYPVSDRLGIDPSLSIRRRASWRCSCFWNCSGVMPVTPSKFVSLTELPSVGIRGNTHFLMSDLNTLDVGNHLSEFLQTKGLD